MDDWNTILSYWGPAYLQVRKLLVSGRVTAPRTLGHSSHRVTMGADELSIQGPCQIAHLTGVYCRALAQVHSPKHSRIFAPKKLMAPTRWAPDPDISGVTGPL